MLVTVLSVENIKYSEGIFYFNGLGSQSILLDERPLGELE